jgi:hypothetical protein
MKEKAVNTSMALPRLRIDWLGKHQNSNNADY